MMKSGRAIFEAEFSEHVPKDFGDICHTLSYIFQTFQHRFHRAPFLSDVRHICTASKTRGIFGTAWVTSTLTSYKNNCGKESCGLFARTGKGSQPGIPVPGLACISCETMVDLSALCLKFMPGMFQMLRVSDPSNIVFHPSRRSSKKTSACNCRIQA